MKNFFSINISLIILVFTSTSVFAVQTPQIYFKYSPGFDALVCKNQYLIQRNEPAELKSLLPTLQMTWNTQQQKLFQTLVKVVRKNFKQMEHTVTLFLCRDFPAMATPLLVWGYPFLKSARGSSALNPSLIIPIAFHEILHLYVSDILPDGFATPLLKKYKNESQLILVHLHVFALEHIVYMAIDPTGQLYNTARKMDESYGLEYRKAWSVVSQEGSSNFVNELVNH